MPNADQSAENQEHLGLIYVALAGVLWGSSGVLAKAAMSFGLSPMSAIVYRLSLASIILFITLALLKPHSLRISLKTLPIVALYGLCGVGVPMMLYFYTVSLISVSTAVTLLYTAPVFTLLTARIIRKEKITSFKLLAAAIILIGCLLATRSYDLGQLRINFIGLITGLGSGIVLAFGTALGKNALDKCDQYTVNLYSTMFSAAFVFVLSFSYSGMPITMDPRFWFVVFMLALLPTTVAQTLYLTGLKHIEAGMAGIASSAEIASAIALTNLFFWEELQLLQVIGICIVIGGVLIIQKS